MAKAKDKDDQFQKETWTYAGRRELKGGKLGGLFLDEKGEEMLWAMGGGMIHRSIGATYEVEVLRDGDHTRARLSGMRFLEAADPDDPRIPAWDLADRAAYTTDAARKAEAKAKREGRDFGELTLKDVRDQIQKLPYGQGTALMAQVMRYIWRNV